MTSRPSTRPLLLWAVRLISAAALSVCLYLLQKKWSGEISSIAGCGGEGGCRQVLGGDWSEWFRLPVTALAALLHAALLVFTIPSVQQRLGRTGEQLFTACGVILAGAAVYFLSILYFVEKQNCPWCLSLHLAGLCEAVLILNHAFRLRRHGERGILEAALFTGGAALTVLAAGQIWGPKPDTHAFTGETTPEVVAAATPGGGRALTFYHNSQPFTFDTAALPILGPVNAKVTFVEFFDYTCSSCRTLNEDLNALKKKWPGALSVVVLPVPLHRGCNTGIPKDAGFEDHQSACELARLGLTMWKASPDRFPAYHQLLLTLPTPVSAQQVAAAQRKGEELAGAAAFAQALADPWVQDRLNENIRIYSLLIRERNGTGTNVKMPKLFLHGGIMMSGIYRSTGEFINEMEKRFDFAGSGAPR